MESASFHDMLQATRRLLANAGRPNRDISIVPQPGGRNNRAYRVTAGGQHFFLKHYFRHPDDARDRFASETAFLRFCAGRGLTWTPRILAADESSGLALMEFVEGSSVTPAAVNEADVDQAIAFFRELNRHRDDPSAQSLPLAADMRDTIAGHVALVDDRVRRLDRIPAGIPECDRARAMIQSRLIPIWATYRERLARAVAQESDQPVPRSNQALSPSDFGFHNARRRANGTLCFFDFEYAGWDDPAKTLADFFLQPAVPPPTSRYAAVECAMAETAGVPIERFAPRAHLLYPVFAVKWCCILLNEFMPVDSARRGYAQPDMNVAERRSAQLERLSQRLEDVHREVFA